MEQSARKILSQAIQRGEGYLEKHWVISSKRTDLGPGKDGVVTYANSEIRRFISTLKEYARTTGESIDWSNTEAVAAFCNQLNTKLEENKRYLASAYQRTGRSSDLEKEWTKFMEWLTALRTNTKQGIIGEINRIKAEKEKEKGNKDKGASKGEEKPEAETSVTPSFAEIYCTLPAAIRTEGNTWRLVANDLLDYVGPKNQAALTDMLQELANEGVIIDLGDNQHGLEKKVWSFNWVAYTRHFHELQSKGIIPTTEACPSEPKIDEEPAKPSEEKPSVNPDLASLQEVITTIDTLQSRQNNLNQLNGEAIAEIDELKRRLEELQRTTTARIAQLSGENEIRDSELQAIAKQLPELKAQSQKLQERIQDQNRLVELTEKIKTSIDTVNDDELLEVVRLRQKLRQQTAQ